MTTETRPSFTPGPWNVAGDQQGFDYGIRNTLVVRCSAYPIAEMHAPLVEQNDANARLIAAAPDLYEALDALLSLVRARNLAAPLDKNGVIDVDALTYADTALAVSRRALAKADGR